MLLMHSLTDEKGTFQISGIKSGKYILKISRVGYQTINSSVFELKDSLNKDFGLLLMKAESTQLGEVVIRSSIPLIQQESNGTIINVENNILTKGSSVLEVLERSPGVVVDRRNN
jgi:iron complex outermembrane receptor protein